MSAGPFAQFSDIAKITFTQQVKLYTI